MVKIAAVIPGPGDATSLYRAHGPFNHLRKMMDVEVVNPEVYTWFVIKAVDMVFLQRPCVSDHLKIAQMAKNCDVPLWIDMDDDLFDVPMENPCWENYREESMKGLIAECLKLATVITVATEPLKVKLEGMGFKNIFVIQNATDEAWFKNYEPLKKPKNPKIIFWRGSSSHVKDLMSVTEDIVKLSNEFPDLIWRFAGYFPWFIAEKLADKTIQHVKHLDPFEYFQFLKISDHAISIVPLVDNPLNRSKSNIAWQESTLAGALTVVPSLPEWQNLPGTISYGPTKSFYEATKEAILHPTRELLCEMSLNHLRDHLCLDSINQERSELILSLLRLNNPSLRL